MKKLLALIFAGFVALLSTGAMAAGVVTDSIDTGAGSSLSVLTFNVTADAADGTVPAYTSANVVDGLVCRVIVDPDDTAVPTDNYDLTLKDKWGIDVMEGLLTDCDTTATVAVDYVPTVNSGAAVGCVLVRGPLTLGMSGNSVNSAKTVVRVLILR